MEQKLSQEDREYIRGKLEEANMIAYSLGERLFEATNDVGVSVHAACILYASTCAINNVDPKMAKVLFDRMHEQITEAMQEPEGPLQ